MFAYRALVVFSAAALAACTASEGARPPTTALSDAIAIVDVALVPLDSDRVLPSQTVVVRAGVIVAVGPSTSLKAPAGARVIDGAGKFLMPGLVDMHTHLVHEADLALYVARGVTTVRNMWGAPMHLAWRDTIERGAIVGPTIVTAGPIVDGDPPIHDGSLVVRNGSEARSAVSLHKQLGYDFLKVYSNLDAATFDALAVEAKAAALPFGGHVPRQVGMLNAVRAGQRSIEHLTAFSEALQADDSPVRGKFDRPSRAKKLDYVDAAKMKPLMKTLHDSGVWICPTRVVMSQNEGPKELEARLARPETRYVGKANLAIWRGALGRKPEQIAADARDNAFAEKVLTALHEAHVKILVGTDPGNPFVVPGYSVHEGLEALVHAGYTAYEALSAATAGAAEYLGRADLGTIAVGKRADLLLVDADPISDVRNADRIAGVMNHGRWLDGAALDAMLVSAEAATAEEHAAVEPRPTHVEGVIDYSGTFRVIWSDAIFGVERVTVGHDDKGDRVIAASAVELHEGQRRTLQLWPGESGRGVRLLLDSDGAIGRGHAELTRDHGHLRGHDATLLSGAAGSVDAPVDDAALLDVHDFFAGMFLLAPTLSKLAVGESIEGTREEIGLGSKVDVDAHKRKVTRVADEGGAARFEITEGDGPPATLSLDSKGFPLRSKQRAFGAELRFERAD